MKAFQFVIMLLLVLFITILSTSQASASTIVWIVLGSPNSPLSLDSTFTTDLKISSWNGVAGALELVIRYDPAVFEYIGFSIPTDSYFFSNCSTYSEPNNPGMMKLACFQVTNWESQETPILLGRLTWKVIGQIGSATDIKIEAPTVVASDWSPVEVIVYGQHIINAPYGIFLPIVLGNR